MTLIVFQAYIFGRLQFPRPFVEVKFIFPALLEAFTERKIVGAREIVKCLSYKGVKDKTRY